MLNQKLTVANTIANNLSMLKLLHYLNINAKLGEYTAKWRVSNSLFAREWRINSDLN